MLYIRAVIINDHTTIIVLRTFFKFFFLEKRIVTELLFAINFIALIEEYLLSIMSSFVRVLQRQLLQIGCCKINLIITAIISTFFSRYIYNHGTPRQYSQ